MAKLNSVIVLTSALENGPATVKELSAATQLSESRVRELLASLDNILSDGGRPAKFWIESADSEEQVQESFEIEGSPSESSACPFCNAEDADLVPAGPEGSFLGDSVLTCTKCERSHNVFSKVEVSLPKSRKTRKAPLNPQYRINAKVSAVEAVGGSLTFDKSSRLWALQLPHHKDPVLLTSLEFSQVDHKSILELN